MARLAAGKDEGGSSSGWALAHLSVDLNAQWPMLKYMAFGFYYAWIWLMYSSFLMVPEEGSPSAVYDAYIVSTTVLALCLAGAAAFHRRVAPLLLKRPFLVGSALLALAGTLMVGFLQPAGLGSLVLANAMTAVGTCAFALRLGQLYSTIGPRESLMAAGASFVVAASLFFVGIGLGRSFGIVFASFLPFVGCLLLFLDTDSESMQASGAYDRGLLERPMRSLFVRLLAGIFLISFAIGVARGYVALSKPLESGLSPGAVMAFGTAVVALLLLLAVGSVSRSLNLAKAYPPVMLTVVACFIVLSLISGDSSVLVDVLGIGYAFVGLVIWCLFSAVSHASSMSPVMVFGWGRCAWGAAATLGWVFGKVLFDISVENESAVTVVMVCMGFLVMVTVMLVLGEKHIEGMLTLAPSKDEGEQAARGDGMGSWRRRCTEIADAHGLSPRETEVFMLLAKGRTIEYIAAECGVSANTSKAHVRHVYVKLDVHTRQELLDLIESF